MTKLYQCSVIKNGKVVELKNFYTKNEAYIFSSEIKSKGYMVETLCISVPDNKKKEQKHEVQYIPPPRWGGRVVCVETGWIFTSIATAAKYMNASQWALRKAVIRNTVFCHFHWRMYNDLPKRIEKFT